ncbi:MAG: serine protease [Hyphomicrobiaceae bacterium]|nr:serine protease [Hyphomicrobiaceae bacterium]
MMNSCKSTTRNTLAALLFSVAPAILAGPSALAADVPLFSPDSYGLAVLPLNESLGKSADTIAKQGNIFEPLSQLRKDDPLRVRARAIGRLDILVEKAGKKSLVTCTATIISADLLLTNYHCIPGKQGKIVKASLLLDYEKSDGSGTTRIPVEPRALEGDAGLDYALARMLGPVPSDISPLKLSTHSVKPREQLLMIHHPAGQTKKMSRFKCLASKSTPQKGPYVRHICESLPGSSGGILFNTSTGAVGLHHSGGLDKNDPDSFNKGTLLARLVASSRTLKKLVRHIAAPKKPLPSLSGPKNARNTGSTGNTGNINDLLENAQKKQADTSSHINDMLSQP